MTLKTALLKAIDGLNDSGIDYTLAGGFALSAHVDAEDLQRAADRKMDWNFIRRWIPDSPI